MLDIEIFLIKEKCLWPLLAGRKWKLYLNYNRNSASRWKYLLVILLLTLVLVAYPCREHCRKEFKEVGKKIGWNQICLIWLQNFYFFCSLFMHCILFQSSCTLWLMVIFSKGERKDDSTRSGMFIMYCICCNVFWSQVWSFGWDLIVIERCGSFLPTLLSVISSHTYLLDEWTSWVYQKLYINKNGFNT